MCIRTIIWDWNGTLLNDIDLCVQTINVLLKKRNLPCLDKKRYKEVFSFPVKDYYQAAGFDFSKENFSIPASEFINQYNARVNNYHLHPGAIPFLEYFKSVGIRQFILSAMKQDKLDETVLHQNLLTYFESIHGLNNHYAHSKVEVGIQLMKSKNILQKETCIIGDTIHDYEVAQELGIKCILIADGHQSAARLKTTNTTVVSSLGDLKNLNLFKLRR